MSSPRYKKFIEKGWDRIKDLGPNVLGPVHPVINEVITELRRITGLDEVSFHMSGTEAVMAAVRLVRFNKQRKLVVTFGGAYVGTPAPPRRVDASSRPTNDESTAGLMVTPPASHP